MLSWSGRVLLALVLVVVLGFVSSGAERIRFYDAPPPIVPKQTPIQQERFQALSANAKELSDNAAVELMALFDTPEFRANISNLEMFTNQSSQFMLDTLNSYIRLNVITHGLPAQAQPSYLDVTLNELINLPFVPNQFERISLGLFNISANPEYIFLVEIENTAETVLFGFPNFNYSFAQLPLNASDSRVSYGALDLFRPSTSTQYFGAVQLGLRPSYINNMTILAPFDTGGYTTCCIMNQTDLCSGARCEKSNNVTFGTIEYFNHLYLQSSWYIKYELYQLFQVLFGPPVPLPELAQFAYFEADVMGNLLLPDAVQYVIGDFTHLFGTEQENVLRMWCIENNFPLVWGKGFAGAFTIVFPGPVGYQNESFVDPYTLKPLGNVTVDENVVTAFSSMRDLVNSTLTETPSLVNSTSFWDNTWSILYKDIIPDNLHFHYLKPSLCGSDCFGIDDSNSCFCA